MRRSIFSPITVLRLGEAHHHSTVVEAEDIKGGGVGEERRKMEGGGLYPLQCVGFGCAPLQLMIDATIPPDAGGRIK